MIIRLLLISAFIASCFLLFSDEKTETQNLSKVHPEITFLEFGSKGCVPCKMMEKVMDEIKQKYPEEIVKVEFIEAKKNRELFKKYKILTIPTQILLDKENQVVFKHTGYISSKDLIKVINTQLEK